MGRGFVLWTLRGLAVGSGGIGVEGRKMVRGWPGQEVNVRMQGWRRR